MRCGVCGFRKVSDQHEDGDHHQKLKPRRPKLHRQLLRSGVKEGDLPDLSFIRPVFKTPKEKKHGDQGLDQRSEKKGEGVGQKNDQEDLNKKSKEDQEDDQSGIGGEG